jgi:hypothetical protein
MSTKTTTKIGKPIKRRDPDPDEKDLEPVGSTQLKLKPFTTSKVTGITGDGMKPSVFGTLKYTN